MGQAQSRTIVLVGKTGNGKSSTGNSIIGRTTFKTGSDLSRVTREMQLETTKIDGEAIIVVDGPGLGDTFCSHETHIDEIITSVDNAFAKRWQGFNAIVFVARYGLPFTQADLEHLDSLTKIFGGNAFSRYGIVLVTCGDQFKPEESGMLFENWWQTKSSLAFQTLVNKCNRRILLFDNRSGTKTVLQDQRSRLMAMVSDIGSSPYTKEMYDAAKPNRIRYLVETGKSALEERVHTNIESMRVKSKNLKNESRNIRLQEIKLMFREIDDLLQHIIAKDKSTGVLNDLKSDLRNTKELVLREHGFTNAMLEGEDRGPCNFL